MEKTWEEMSSDEKQEAQFQKLLAPKDPEGNDLKFQSAETEAAYKASINRIKNAIQLKKPEDRVPVCLFPGMFPVAYAGMTMEEAASRCSSLSCSSRRTAVCITTFSVISIVSRWGSRPLSSRAPHTSSMIPAS